MKKGYPYIPGPSRARPLGAVNCVTQARCVRNAAQSEFVGQIIKSFQIFNN